MEHPDVRLLVAYAVALPSTTMGRNASGTTYRPLSGNCSPVRSSHSPTVARTVLLRGAMRRMRVPSRQWMRSHGSGALSVHYGHGTRDHGRRVTG
ncbi:MAG: hypothetical protein DMD83_03005 [Candidatus Rokuibacteriota bacterium]|nr:MAG: hypothetical protein DMD83_03005 [Candidatus Rokubacteria bacterium]